MDPTSSGSGAAGRATDAPAPDLAPGAVLDGRWRIEALLGSGGMGAVYRAEHVHVGRKAAVKVLHADLRRSAADRERFRREARVASKLRSPHVVEVLDFGEDEAGRAYLAMELLEGESLRAVLEREGRLAPVRAVRLLRQLLDGLAAAHDAGIVHRDLKPENLWLSGRGADETLKVLDFGIAKWSEARADAAMTQAGLVLGTPEYLAPEQAVGGEVDRRADLYAAGILGFVMLTGRHPFDTSDIRALVAAHAFERVPSVSSAAPALAAWPKLVDFVARATEKDRALRAASAAELTAMLDGAEVPVRPSRDARPPGAVPAHTPRAVRASLLGVPSAALPEAVNLTLVRVELAAWPEQAGALASAARARALAAHDALVLPIVRAFAGRRLAAEDGASVFAFRSPTDAVECAAALQDAAARARADARPSWAAELRIGAHQGEVRLERDAVAGAPLATVRAVAASAGAGEVWLTRAVWLTMNRSEAPADEMGPRAVEGEPEPLVLYRLTRDRGELPYGGRHLARAGGARRSRLLEPVRTPLASIQVAGETEGRARAAARVTGAALGLLGNRLVRIAVALGKAPLWLAAPRRRAPDGLVGRGYAALDRARQTASARAPLLALELRRPRGTREG
ncbi:MAG TPA: protein kinase [Anaeromyxobacter sp.]|nr:protein kinase [Anaeromyxobacter sp.]